MESRWVEGGRAVVIEFIRAFLRLGSYTIMVYKVLMAEKRKPTYDLDAFKTTFATVERLAVTGSALRGAASLGYGRATKLWAQSRQCSEAAIFINL
jgi:hypothetical protein